MTGRIKRPPQNGKYPPALIDRDREVVFLIRDVVQIYGLHSTPSDEVGGHSACHAVAQGVRLLRLQPDSYPAIKRIWLGRAKERPEPEFLGRNAFPKTWVKTDNAVDP